MRISVKVPKKGKWSIDNRYRRASANTTLHLVEKLLLKAVKKEKTSVRVSYLDRQHNESYPSYNVCEQVYATACFIEEYLSEVTMKKYEKSV